MERVQYLCAGTLSAIVTNMFLKEGQTPFKPESFFPLIADVPDWEREDDDDLQLQKAIANAQLFAAKWNANWKLKEKRQAAEKAQPPRRIARGN